MASRIEFKRGDDTTHFFVLPSATWSAGGKLHFTAKPAVDDDSTDASAVINRTFTDAVAVDDGTSVTYTLYFPAADTNTIESDGDSSREYLAEFQYVTQDGLVSSFPGNDKYLQAVVYFDIRRSIV